MAEYVRFRLAAAKVGASMALLALVAGVAEKAQAATRPAVAQTAASFLKLGGLTKTISQDFSKIEKKLIKLDSAFLKFEQKVIRSYYTKSQIDDKYLKITDANAKFLKVDGTAADSNKLGGVPASGFLQGKGAVLSNSLLLPAVQTGQQQVLLGDGSVRVLIALDQAGAPTVTLENDTSASINFTLVGGVTAGGQNSANGAVPAGGNVALAFHQSAQMDIQMFGGGGGAGKVWTATVSSLATQAGQQFVGQMLIGLL